MEFETLSIIFSFGAIFMVAFMGCLLAIHIYASLSDK